MCGMCVTYSNHFLYNANMEIVHIQKATNLDSWHLVQCTTSECHVLAMNNINS